MDTVLDPSKKKIPRELADVRNTAPTPLQNYFRTHHLLYILFTEVLYHSPPCAFISYSELEPVLPSLPQYSSYIHPFCVFLVLARCYLTCTPYLSCVITTSSLPSLPARIIPPTILWILDHHLYCFSSYALATFPLTFAYLYFGFILTNI